MTASLALGIALLFAAAAHAQTTPAPLPPKTGETGPVTAAPPAGNGTGVQSGVIRPPAIVDPGINKPTPNGGAFPTPVIPPPGSPGGNPAVVPK